MKVDSCYSIARGIFNRVIGVDVFLLVNNTGASLCAVGPLHNSGTAPKSF